MYNRSEVARLREKIEQECQAMKAGLNGYARVSKHATINHKYDAIGSYQEQLGALLGDEEAAKITIEAYQNVMG